MNKDGERCSRASVSSTDRGRVRSGPTRTRASESKAESAQRLEHDPAEHGDIRRTARGLLVVADHGLYFGCIYRQSVPSKVETFRRASATAHMRTHCGQLQLVLHDHQSG